MRYVCTVCGYIYDEDNGAPGAGIAPGTKWGSLPDSWTCPLCGAPKKAFDPQEPEREKRVGNAEPVKAEPVRRGPDGEENSKQGGFSFGEMSALCSNLAKGCEKQYLEKEAGLFSVLADYCEGKTGFVKGGSLGALHREIQGDLESAYPKARDAAETCSDRGAKRALVWSEKATRMQDSLLERYEKEGGAFAENANVYVCEICGFIYVGDNAPFICPVCKVPKLKITQI